MATLTTLTLVRDTGNLPAAVDDGQLQPHINTASLQIEAATGEADYAAAVAEIGGSPTLKTRQLQVAETNLALAYSLPALATAMENGDPAEGAAGIYGQESMGDTVVSFLKPAEVKTLTAGYMAIANGLIAGALGGFSSPVPKLVRGRENDGTTLDDNA